MKPRTLTAEERKALTERDALRGRRDDAGHVLLAIVHKAIGAQPPESGSGAVALSCRIPAGERLDRGGWRWLQCLDGTGEETPLRLLYEHVRNLRLIPKTAFTLDELEEAFRKEDDPLVLVARFCPDAWANHCRARDEV